MVNFNIKDKADWIFKYKYKYIYIYIYIYIQGVAGRIVNILGGGSMDYSE